MFGVSVRFRSVCAYITAGLLMLFCLPSVAAGGLYKVVSVEEYKKNTDLCSSWGGKVGTPGGPPLNPVDMDGIDSSKKYIYKVRRSASTAKGFTEVVDTLKSWGGRLSKKNVLVCPVQANEHFKSRMISLGEYKDDPSQCGEFSRFNANKIIEIISPADSFIFHPVLLETKGSVPKWYTAAGTIGFTRSPKFSPKAAPSELKRDYMVVCADPSPPPQPKSIFSTAEHIQNAKSEFLEYCKVRERRNGFYLFSDCDCLVDKVDDTHMVAWSEARQKGKDIAVVNERYLNDAKTRKWQQCKLENDDDFKKDMYVVSKLPYAGNAKYGGISGVSHKSTLGAFSEGWFDVYRKNSKGISDEHIDLVMSCMSEGFLDNPTGNFSGDGVFHGYFKPCSDLVSNGQYQPSSWILEAKKVVAAEKAKLKQAKLVRLESEKAERKAQKELKAEINECRAIVVNLWRTLGRSGMTESESEALRLIGEYRVCIPGCDAGGRFSLLGESSNEYKALCRKDNLMTGPVGAVESVYQCDGSYQEKLRCVQDVCSQDVGRDVARLCSRYQQDLSKNNQQVSRQNRIVSESDGAVQKNGSSTTNDQIETKRLDKLTQVRRASLSLRASGCRSLEGERLFKCYSKNCPALIDEFPGSGEAKWCERELKRSRALHEASLEAEQKAASDAADKTRQKAGVPGAKASKYDAALQEVRDAQACQRDAMEKQKRGELNSVQFQAKLMSCYSL